MFFCLLWPEPEPIETGKKDYCCPDSPDTPDLRAFLMSTERSEEGPPYGPSMRGCGVLKQKEMNENQALGAFSAVGETSAEGAKDWRASVDLSPIHVPGGKQPGGGPWSSTGLIGRVCASVG